jgi:hypothetical protein
LALVALSARARAQAAEPPAAPVVPIARAEGVVAPEGGPAGPPPAALNAPAGASQRPLVAPSAKAARVPLAKRWWFWAGLGAAAVGIVLAAIFVGPRDPYNGNANPGTVFF